MPSRIPHPDFTAFRELRTAAQASGAKSFKFKGKTYVRKDPTAKVPFVRYKRSARRSRAKSALCGFKAGDNEFVQTQNADRERMTCAIGLDVHYELDMASNEGSLEEQRLQPFNPRISGPPCPHNFTGKFVDEETYRRLYDDPVELAKAIEQATPYDEPLYKMKDPRLTTQTVVIRDFGCKIPIEMADQQALARAVLNNYPDQYVTFLNEFVSNLMGDSMRSYLSQQIEGYRKLLENPGALNRLSWSCYVATRGPDFDNNIHTHVNAGGRSNGTWTHTDITLPLPKHVMGSLQKLADNGTGMTSNVSPGDVFDLRPCIEQHIQTYKLMHDDWCHGFATTETNALAMMVYANDQALRLCWDRRLIQDSEHAKYETILLHVPLDLTQAVDEETLRVVPQSNPDLLSTIFSNFATPGRECTAVRTFAFEIGKWSGSDDSQNVFLNTVSAAPFRWGWGHAMNLFHAINANDPTVGPMPPVMPRFLCAPYLRYKGNQNNHVALSRDGTHNSHTFCKPKWYTQWRHADSQGVLVDSTAGPGGRDSIIPQSSKPTRTTLRSQLLQSGPDVTRGEGAMHFRGTNGDYRGSIAYHQGYARNFDLGNFPVHARAKNPQDVICDDDKNELFNKLYTTCGDDVDPFLKGGGCIGSDPKSGLYALEKQRFSLYSQNFKMNPMVHRIIYHAAIIRRNAGARTANDIRNFMLQAPGTRDIVDYVQFANAHFDYVLRRLYQTGDSTDYQFRILFKGMPSLHKGSTPDPTIHSYSFVDGLFPATTLGPKDDDAKAPQLLNLKMDNVKAHPGFPTQYERLCLKFVAFRKSLQYCVGPCVAYTICRDPAMLYADQADFNKKWDLYMPSNLVWRPIESPQVREHNARVVDVQGVINDNLTLPLNRQKPLPTPLPKHRSELAARLGGVRATAVPAGAGVPASGIQPAAQIATLHTPHPNTTTYCMGPALQMGTIGLFYNGNLLSPLERDEQLLKFMLKIVKERYDDYKKATPTELSNIVHDAVYDWELHATDVWRDEQINHRAAVQCDLFRNNLKTQLDVINHNMSAEFASAIYSNAFELPDDTVTHLDPLMMYCASLREYTKLECIDEWLRVSRLATLQNPPENRNFNGDRFPIDQNLKGVLDAQLDMDPYKDMQSRLQEKSHYFDQFFDDKMYRGIDDDNALIDRLTAFNARPLFPDQGDEIGPVPDIQHPFAFQTATRSNDSIFNDGRSGLDHHSFAFLPIHSDDHSVWMSSGAGGIAVTQNGGVVPALFEDHTFNVTANVQHDTMPSNRPMLFSMLDAAGLMWYHREFYNSADSHRPKAHVRPAPEKSGSVSDNDTEYGTVDDMHPWCMRLIESFVYSRQVFRQKYGGEKVWEEVVHKDPETAFPQRMIGAMSEDTFKRMFPLVPLDHKLRDKLRRLRSLDIMWGTLPSYVYNHTSAPVRGAWMPLSEAQRCALLKECGLFDRKYRVPSNPWLPRNGEGLCQVFNQSYHSVYSVDDPTSTHYREWVRDVCRYNPPQQDSDMCRYPFSQYGGTPVEADFLVHRVQRPEDGDEYYKQRHAHLVFNRFGFTKAFRLGQQYKDNGMLQDLYSFEHRQHLKLEREQKRHITQLNNDRKKPDAEVPELLISNFMAYARNHVIMALASNNHGTTRMSETRLVRNLYRMWVDAFEVCAAVPSDNDLVPVVMGFAPNMVRSKSDRPVTMYAGPLPCLNSKIERFCHSNANLGEKICKNYKQVYLNDATLLFLRLVRADRRKRVHQSNYRRARNHRQSSYTELDFYKELVDVQDAYVEFLQTTLLSMALESDVDLKNLPLHLLEPREVEVQMHIEDTDVVGNDFLGPRTTDIVSDFKLDGDTLSRTQLAILSLMPPNHRIIGTMRLDQQTEVLDLEHLRKQVQKNTIESNKKVWESYLQRVIRASLGRRFLEENGPIDFSLDETSFKDPLAEAAQIPSKITAKNKQVASTITQNLAAQTLRKDTGPDSLVRRNTAEYNQALDAVRDRVSKDYEKARGNKSHLQCLLELRIPEQIKNQLKSEYQSNMIH